MILELMNHPAGRRVPDAQRRASPQAGQALAVRGDVATANRLDTMSDFARWVGGGARVVLVCSAEFANAGTLASLERTYGFKLRSQQLIVLAGGETSATIAA